VIEHYSIDQQKTRRRQSRTSRFETGVKAITAILSARQASVSQLIAAQNSTTCAKQHYNPG
jgi:hypothetical protein